MTAVPASSRLESLNHLPASTPSIARTEFTLLSAMVGLVVLCMGIPLVWFFIDLAFDGVAEFGSITMIGTWVITLLVGVFVLLFLGMGLSYNTHIEVVTDDGSVQAFNRIHRAVRGVAGMQDVATGTTKSLDGRHTLRFGLNLRHEKHGEVLQGLRDMGLVATVRSR